MCGGEGVGGGGAGWDWELVWVVHVVRLSDGHASGGMGGHACLWGCGMGLGVGVGCGLYRVNQVHYV